MAAPHSQGRRCAANARDGSVYTVPDRYLGGNFAIAVCGVLDSDGMALPVAIATSCNYEKPAITDGSELRPAGMPLTLTVTVSNTTEAVPYVLYRYASEADVPTSAFNRQGARAASVTRFLGDASGRWSTILNVSSADMVFLRCVPATAP